MPAGGSGFTNAGLRAIPPALACGPVTLADGDELLLRVSVRSTCSPAGHNSGVARLWYKGKDIGVGSTRDAGSRFEATIGSSDDCFLRTGSSPEHDATRRARSSTQP